MMEMDSIGKGSILFSLDWSGHIEKYKFFDASGDYLCLLPMRGEYVTTSPRVLRMVDRTPGNMAERQFFRTMAEAETARVALGLPNANENARVSNRRETIFLASMCVAALLLVVYVVIRKAMGAL